MRQRSPRVLIIVQNLPVPLDRRVWLECQALTAAGIGVSVICPKGEGDPARSEIDGVRLYKYRPAPAAQGLAGYAWEFVYSWAVTAWLSVVVAVRDGFDAIQACNPPDTFWALACLWRPFGKKFVYDQHDLNPEVFLSRFGEPEGLAARLQLRGLRWLEAMSYRTADEVVSTNESYRRTAIERGGCDPAHVTVVRSAPNTRTMRPVEPPADLRKGARHLAVYLGIMGPQDGVDQALHAFAHLVHERKRTDCHFALLGFGDSLDELKRLATELDLDDHVTFTGRVGLAEIADYLSAADVGICPDPSSPLNDVSTMNKVMEYMAYCVPMVTFELAETRVSAGDAAVYLASGDIPGFAAAWERLLDDPDERVRRGLYARERVAGPLDWAHQSRAYVAVWRRLLGLPAVDGSTDRTAQLIAEPPFGRVFIPLDNQAILARFVRDRTLAAAGTPDTGPDTMAHGA